MATFYPWVRGTGDHGELIPYVLHRLKIGRRGVARPIIFRDEVRIVQTQRERNSNETLGILRSRGREGRNHGVEHRQPEGNAGSFEYGAAWKGFSGGDVHGFDRSLFAEEDLAGERGVNEGAESVVFARGLFQDLFEVRSVAEVKVTTGTIPENLAGESPGQHFRLLQVDFSP